MSRTSAINREYAKKDEKPYSGDWRSLYTDKYSEWMCPEDDNFIKLLPPKQDEIYFGLEVWFHQDVGVNNDKYVCPAKMKEVLMKLLDRKEDELPEEIADGKCPICEAQTKLMQQLDKGEKWGKNKAITSLFPKTRMAYLLVDTRDEETIGKGMQIWSAPYTNVDRCIVGICKIKRGERAGEDIDPSLPSEGVDVAFTRKGKGQEDTRYSGFKFEKSALELKEVQELMEEVPEYFEDILNFSSYEEIAEAYSEDVPDSVTDEKDEKKPSVVESKSRLRRRRAQEGDEPSGEPGVAGSEAGEETSDAKTKSQLKNRLKRRGKND